MNKFFNGYTLALSLFLFQLIWIFQGLGSYDVGYHLVHQMSAANLEVSNSLPSLFFLTDLVGGMWLSLINVPSLVWVRIGAILLFSLNALLSYKIVTVYFDRKKVFWAVFATTLFITSLSHSLIEYFTFPSLLLTIALLLFNQLINQQVGSRTFRVYSFLLGFIVIPIVLAKFTLIIILIAPVLVWSYYRIAKKDLSELKTAASFILMGTTASVLVFGLFYQSIGFLDVYIESLKTQLSASAMGDTTKIAGMGHSMSSMLKRYFIEYVNVILLTGIASICLYIISLLSHRWGKRAANLALIALATFGFFSVALSWDASVSTTYFIVNYTGILIRLLIGLTLLTTIIFFLYDKGQSKNLCLLSLLSLFVLLITSFGSNNGLFKSIYGMWLALPLMFLINDHLKEKLENSKLKSIFSLNTVVILLVILISVCLHFTNSYSGIPNRFRLNTPFKYKYLNYIYVDNDRVETVDETLKQINELTEKNDRILMVRVFPQFYYLTETRPLFDLHQSEYIFADSLSAAKVHNRSVAESKYPKLFVYSKKRPKFLGRGQDRLAEYFRDKYINQLGYETVWENATYAITKKP